MDNRVGWKHMGKDQTPFQRTTLIYEYTIILLEPHNHPTLSLSLLLYLNTHFSLISSISSSFFPFLYSWVSYRTECILQSSVFMPAIICATVTACLLITVINYTSVHSSIKLQSRHYTTHSSDTCYFLVPGLNISATSLFSFNCIILHVCLFFCDVSVSVSQCPELESM